MTEFLSRPEYDQRMNALSRAFVLGRDKLKERLLPSEKYNLEEVMPGLIVVGSMGAGPEDRIKKPKVGADFDVKPIVNVYSYNQTDRFIGRTLAHDLIELMQAELPKDQRIDPITAPFRILDNSLVANAIQLLNLTPELHDAITMIVPPDHQVGRLIESYANRYGLKVARYNI